MPLFDPMDFVFFLCSEFIKRAQLRVSHNGRGEMEVGNLSAAFKPHYALLCSCLVMSFCDAEKTESTAPPAPPPLFVHLTLMICTSIGGVLDSDSGRESGRE